MAPLVSLEKDKSKKISGDLLARATDKSGTSYPLASIENNVPRIFFDLKATIQMIRGEHYSGAELASVVATRLPFDYTKLPMWLVGLASKILTKPIDPSGFPDYPAYPADFSADYLYGLGQVAEKRQPLIWPQGKKYCLAFTHDVDTSWIFSHPKWLRLYGEAEEECGFHSAWYVVPKASQGSASRASLSKLVEAGHEIGVHGYSHDPALPDNSLTMLEDKFESGKEILSDYLGVTPGYRAPWLSRNDRMRQALANTGYLYDSSSPSTDFFRNNSIANNGCGTVFPFLQNGVIVIPLTLPMDSIRRNFGKSPMGFWRWIYELIGDIRDFGGMAMITTHIQPHYSANEPMLEGYKWLLGELENDHTAWHALPRDVALWAKENFHP